MLHEDSAILCGGRRGEHTPTTYRPKSTAAYSDKAERGHLNTVQRRSGLARAHLIRWLRRMAYSSRAVPGEEWVTSNRRRRRRTPLVLGSALVPWPKVGGATPFATPSPLPVRRCTGGPLGGGERFRPYKLRAPDTTRTRTTAGTAR